MSTQYPRKCGLVVTQGQMGLDLSRLRIRFRIRAPDVSTPNTAEIRVWNLKDSTAQQVQGEFGYVLLQAGYEGGANYGVIFQGNIKMVRRGRESNISTFVDIMAADGDAAYNFGVVSQTLQAGADNGTIAAAVGASFSQFNVTMPNGTAQAYAATGGILPRGKVLFGMARSALRDLTKTSSLQWYIQNGQLLTVPLSGYAPGTAVKLSAKTGLIGVPESTPNGIKVRCLLNPQIQVGGLIQIDNADINTVNIREQGFPDYTSINFTATVSNDGYYKVLVHEMSGDTRDTEWYSDLTCLAVNLSAPAGQQVSPYLAGTPPSFEGTVIGIERMN